MKVKWEWLLVVIGLIVVIGVGGYLIYDSMTPDQIMLQEDSAAIIERYPDVIRQAEELSGETIAEINSFTIESFKGLLAQDPMSVEYNDIWGDIVDASLRYRTVTQKWY